MERLIGDTEGSAATAEIERVGAMATETQFRAADSTLAPKPEQSGIAEYARVLWRRKWVIILTIVIAVGGVLGYCVLATKTYTATSTVLLEPPVSNLIPTGSNQPAAGASVNVQDIIQVIESSSISNIVAKTIPNPPSVSATQVGQATVLITSDIVQLQVSSGNPQTAAAAANAYANAYISFEKGISNSTFQSAEAQIGNKVATVQLAISNLTAQIRATPAGVNLTADQVELGDLENQLTNLQNTLQQYQFYATQGSSTEVGRVITNATPPSKPSSPHTTEYVVLALIFSAIAGVGLALLVNAISRRRV
ncbi:MAG TPA: Wzz/FepE/Etk N-terminal domain-containing protein [Acidimicrobiales bacterium]|jgi:non-specific protein-tyrosine kinase|nr:Wzz/FepE/Etk N-terminal domain-containing protein [Acidimicrobiales bacterium]